MICFQILGLTLSLPYDKYIEEINVPIFLENTFNRKGRAIFKVGKENVNCNRILRNIITIQN